MRECSDPHTTRLICRRCVFVKKIKKLKNRLQKKEVDDGEKFILCNFFEHFLLQIKIKRFILKIALDVYYTTRATMNSVSRDSL